MTHCLESHSTVPATYPPVILILLYGVMPLWLLADWLCHRTRNLAQTTGTQETLIHLLMFGEVGIALLAALFLEINAGVVALMIAAFLAHEATALWDVSYAVTARRIAPIEQHVHSFLEILPLLAITCVISAHWAAFLSLFGSGPEPAEFSIRMKRAPLPGGYLTALLSGVALFEALPSREELLRGWRASKHASTPVHKDLAPVRNCRSRH
jgi:hypothetical protein